MSAEITRRRFLEAVAGAGWAAALLRCTRPRSAATVLVLELVRQVAVPEPLAVGAAYLRAHRETGGAEALLAEIFSGDSEKRRPRELAAAFGARLREDFEHRRTVEVDGWILSATEARFCALLALDHDSSPTPN